MAITVRKGIEGQFDINKMLPGEFAVTTDTHKVYICMAAGISKELASVEELQNILGASDEAFQAFQELLNAMESDTVITGLLTDVNNIKSGEYTISFAAAETRENIEPTDTLKVIFGKIKKFFTDLAEVALTGKYEDLSGTPTLSKVATSGSYGDLQDAPTLGDAASKAVANNMTTSEAGTHVADAYQIKLLKGQLDEQNTKINELSYTKISIDTSLGTSSGIHVFKLGRIVIASVAINPTSTNISVNIGIKTAYTINGAVQMDAVDGYSYWTLLTDGTLNFTTTKTNVYHRFQLVAFDIS